METTLDTEEIKQEVAGFGALQKTSRLDYLLKIKNLKDLLILSYHLHLQLLFILIIYFFIIWFIFYFLILSMINSNDQL